MDRLDVRVVAAGRWPGILLALGVSERALSGKHGPCQICAGKDRFRFDDKDGRGTYFCSGCGAGDGVQLAMAVTGCSFRDTALQIERLAGSVQHTVSKASRSDEDKVAALRRVWSASKPIQQGDEAVRYLTGRGLSLDSLPENLRLHPSMRYCGDDGVLVGHFPTMLATVTDTNGKAASLHRTYLRDGKKAPVPEPRKLMSSGRPICGAAIRLAPASERLGIAEGIETALAASEMFNLPVWSCISTSGIESFEPPAGVKEVVIFADHDLNFAGQKAAFTAAHRLAIKGLSVEVRIPPMVGDWLNVLEARGAPRDGLKSTTRP